jgi:hypothetical protein
VTAVGRGKTQDKADRNAMKKLLDHEATTDASIVYRYFSYGEDSGSHPAAKTKSSRRSKQTAAAQATNPKT